MPAVFGQYLQRSLVTPSGVFVLACFFGPPLLQLIGHPMNHASLGFAYICAWPVVLWTTTLLVTVYVTFYSPRNVNRLSRCDRWIASWYLCNGFFFNSMMDVFAGQFQSWPTMTDRYNELEPRYAMKDEYDGVTVLLTSWQELLIQTPCALALFYGYWRRRPWRFPVEIIYNMWSVAGVWYFYGSEHVLGFPHVHSPFLREHSGSIAIDPARLLTFDTVYKFWIGFVIFPGLWAVVGLLLTLRCARAIVALQAPAHSK
jgi:hypothetical protein